MIISLIGFMAAGKTTMARELSAKTDIDTIFNRLSKDTGGRTLLENRGDTPLRDVIDRLYREREPLYEALARTTV